MLKYILPILVILMLNTLPLQIFKKKFGEVLPITFISVPIILFITQFIFRTFNVGIILICVLALAGTVALFIRKKNLTDYFSNGFFVFLSVALIILILDFRRSFSDFDEFWHWGPMVKEMLRLDRFYCIDASRMAIHKDYPPFPALYELFAAKVGLGYNEAGINTALHIMCFSVLASPISEKISFAKNRILKSIVFGLSLCVLLLGVGAIFDVPGIMLTILADFPVSAFFALAIFLVLGGDAYDSNAGSVSFLLTCIMIAMTKQIGVPIMLVAVLMFFLVGVFEKKSFLRTIITSAVCTGLPLAFYLGWSKYVSLLGVRDIRTAESGNGQFSLSKRDFAAYISIALKKSEMGIQRVTFWNYLQALFNRKLTSSWISLSFVAVSALIVAVIIILWIRHKNTFTRGKAIAAGLSLSIGTIGYAFMLSVLFLFCFTSDEMLELRGYERYVNSFVAGEIIGLILLTIYLLSKEKNLFEKSRYMILAALAALVLLGTNAYNIAPAIAKDSDPRYNNMAVTIGKSTSPDSDTVLVYDCSKYGTWYGSFHSYIGYYLNDRDFPLDLDVYYTAAIGEDIASILAERSQQTMDEDYLYIIDTNDSLNSALAPFTGTEALLENTVYKYFVDEAGMLQVVPIQ